MKIKDSNVRKQIIQAARSMFLKYGYKNASMSQVAREAHTAVGNLYTYFPSKDSLLENVIGETPIKLDNFIECNYKQAILTMDVLEINKLFEALPDCSYCLDEADSMNFLVMMEGCAGTKYAYYRQGMLEIIKDYTRVYLKGSMDENIIDIISYMFMLKLQQGARIKCGKIGNSHRREKEQEVIEDTSKIYKMQLQEEKKKIKIEFFNSFWYGENEREKFENDYKEIVEEINSKEYTLIIDCRKVRMEAEYDAVGRELGIYTYKPLKNIQILFINRQIALVSQCMRVLKKSGVDNVEIIIK